MRIRISFRPNCLAMNYSCSASVKSNEILTQVDISIWFACLSLYWTPLCHAAPKVSSHYIQLHAIYDHISKFLCNGSSLIYACTVFESNFPFVVTKLVWWILSFLILFYLRTLKCSLLSATFRSTYDSSNHFISISVPFFADFLHALVSEQFFLDGSS